MGNPINRHFIQFNYLISHGIIIISWLCSYLSNIPVIFQERHSGYLQMLPPSSFFRQIFQFTHLFKMGGSNYGRLFLSLWGEFHHSQILLIHWYCHIWNENNCDRIYSEDHVKNVMGYEIWNNERKKKGNQIYGGEETSVLKILIC